MIHIDLIKCVIKEKGACEVEASQTIHMSGNYRIDNLKNHVNSEKSQLSSQAGRLDRDISNTRHWWKGYASNVFRDEFGGINHEIESLIREVDELTSYYKRLSSDVRRADRERRQRRLEQSQ